MKEYRFRIVLILAAIALSVYLLYPTYVDKQNTSRIESVLAQKSKELKLKNPKFTGAEINKILRSVEDSIKASDPSISETRMKRVKLGLDLQGGMRVVIEVNTGKMLDKLAGSKSDDIFKQVLAESEKEVALTDDNLVDVVGRKLQERGIRLSKYFGTIRDEDSDILSRLNKDTEDAVNRAMEIIRNRVDQYGVSEPSIQRQGSKRIIVELPGVAREEEAKQLLQGTALLEFRIVKDPELTISVMQRIDDVLAGKVLDDSTKTDSTKQIAENNTDSTKVDSNKVASNDSANKQQLSQEEFAKQHPFFSVALLDPQSQVADAYVKEEERIKITSMLNRPEVQKVIPNNVEFVFSAKPIGMQEGKGVYILYMVNKEPELTGSVITDALANIDPSTSAPIVNMTMNTEGATQWARITGANVNKRIAIILDGLVFSAPNVKNKITGGRSQIEGMANMEEAKLLEIILKAGALPAPVDIIEERSVGPSLGEDSIASGFNSALIGFLLVALFMIIYYTRAGTIAAVCLIFTILFILGILAGFSATLTLPGIAGIILTIGMAVDANVLIFERIREELATGKTLKASIDSGFSKANSAIIDSNITTFFTGIILYQFGSGPVQGFALTLMIGIAASLFSALVIARVIFDIMVAKGAKISLG